MDNPLKQLEKTVSQIRSDIEEVRPYLPAIAADILRQVKKSFKVREKLVSYSTIARLSYPFLANQDWVDSYLDTFQIVVDNETSVRLFLDPKELVARGFPEDFPAKIETGDPVTDLPSIVHLREKYDV